MSTYAAIQAFNSQARPVPFNGGSNLIGADIKSGPKALVQNYDFGATGIPTIGYQTLLQTLIQQGNFQGVQTLFIDNTANNGPVQISSPAFGQLISLPAGYQGYFPILASSGSGNSFYIISNGTGIANVSYLNVQMPFGLWAGLVAPPSAGAPLAVSDSILDATVIAGRQQVQAINAPCVFTDVSGSIAVANTSQLLLPANAARRGFRVQNIDYTNNGEGIWINDSGSNAVVGGAGSFGAAAAASSSYPGGSYDSASTDAVYIIATTAGHLFTAKWW